MAGVEQHLTWTKHWSEPDFEAFLNHVMEQIPNAKALIEDFSKKHCPANVKIATDAALADPDAKATISFKSNPPTTIITMAPPEEPSTAPAQTASQTPPTQGPSGIDMDCDGFTIIKKSKRKLKTAQTTVPVKRLTKRAISRPTAPQAPTPVSRPEPPPTQQVPTTQRVPSEPPQVAPQADVPMTPVKQTDKTPPPLFLQDKSQWNNVSSAMRAAHINFTNARSTQQGIKITVQTPKDHRALTALLRSKKLAFFTFALEEERDLRVVIRGLPKEIEIKQIETDLKNKGFHVRGVHRLYKKQTTKVHLDLVLVSLPLTAESKAIYNITTLCNLSGIKVEVPHTRGAPGQCHNCQTYGHAAKNCDLPPRCVKCLTSGHSTANCTRGKGPLPCCSP